MIKQQKVMIYIEIIVAIMAILSVLVDVCFIPVRREISLILMIILIGLNVLKYIKGKTLKGKILYTVQNIFILVFVLIGTYFNPYRNSISFNFFVNYDCEEFGTELSYQESVEDLNEAMTYLEDIHPLFIDGLSLEVQAVYDQALINLQDEDHITINVLNREIEKIYSCLRDGHTAAQAYFPVEHRLKYVYGHKTAGDELVAVNGISLKELFEEKSDLFSYETDAYGMERLKRSLETLEGLDYLEIGLNDGITYSYLTSDGELLVEKCYTEDYLTSEEYWEYNGTENRSSNKPFVSYQVYESDHLAVLTLTSCRNNKEYKKCLSEMFREVMQSGIDNVCVDLRNNSGGSSYVANEFIRYLDVDEFRTEAQDRRMGPIEFSIDGDIKENKKQEEYLFTGNVYVLTSTYTYSSAMDFAMYISDNNLGKIVGEPSGNIPECFGEIATFKLPNSGIIVSVSTTKFYRVDETNSDELIEPDIRCKSNEALETLAEYLKKED